MDGVSLVNPSFSYPRIKKRSPIYNRIWPPLCLANSAAILENNGFDVQIIDANAEDVSPEKIADRIRNSNKVFVTSSTIDRWQCPHLNVHPVIEVIRKIKEKNPRSNVYLLGAHGTIRPKEMLDLTDVNAVIRQEPEEAILNICGGNDLSHIRGLTYRHKGRIISTSNTNGVDLSKPCIPAFHLLPMRKYFYEILGNHFALFEGSRGCPFSCVFCSKSMYCGYRTKPAENLIKEVEYAIEHFGVRTAYFIDLEFTINKTLVEHLCDYLIEKRHNFRWCCQTRLDSINKGLLIKMKKAGCELIHYGVETGSERIMGLISKGVTLEKIERGINLTHEVGIETACFFMFGFINETKDEMKKTITFSKKLNPTYASFHVVAPYPGTRFHDMVIRKEELFPTSYHDVYTYEELKSVVEAAFLEFYMRPRYILRRINPFDKLFLNKLRLFLRYLSEGMI